VHEVLDDAASLDARVDAVLSDVLASGPNAARAAKSVIRDQRGLDPDARRSLTVGAIARQRTSPEGQEGLTAFLEKRSPSWGDR
jgi:methylglutaconyl-CoA hydratase